MTPNGQQNENSDDKKVSGLSEKGPENAGRRRFARSGLAASGIIATLTSRPVLATVCKSPSGSLSGNLSNHHQDTVCEGRSPGFWKNHKWPGLSKDTLLFRSVFTVSSSSSPLYDMTMRDVLYTKDDKHNLAMHLVAGYLNYTTGRSPFLDTSRLQAMWNELQLTGYFTPTAGKQWNAEQVVSYIQSTFIKIDPL